MVVKILISKRGFHENSLQLIVVNFLYRSLVFYAVLLRRSAKTKIGAVQTIFLMHRAGGAKAAFLFEVASGFSLGAIENLRFFFGTIILQPSRAAETKTFPRIIRRVWNFSHKFSEH